MKANGFTAAKFAIANGATPLPTWQTTHLSSRIGAQRLERADRLAADWIAIYLREQHNRRGGRRLVEFEWPSVLVAQLEVFGNARNFDAGGLEARRAGTRGQRD
jgi:hypothetical protein